VEFDAAVLHVRRVKNGTPSTQPLRGDELRALRRLQRESDALPFVFVSERGSPFTTAGFARMVERATASQASTSRRIRICSAMPAATRLPTRDTTRARSCLARTSLDHQQGDLHGTGTESVQGYLAGLSAGDARLREFVVFYVWQSDRLERFNRHVIRFALNLAAKSISDDPTIDVQVRVDADTEGVLGQVPVTDTILKKIAACDAFVPDLTFVAMTEAGKLVPNPNVLIEYGYALRAKSHSVMIPVMNTAYGPADQLPFDMRHLRHPLRYELRVEAKNTQRRAVRETLTNEFEAILRRMIAEAAPQPDKAARFREAVSISSPAFYFPLGATIATFGQPSEQEYRFEDNNAIYLRLFPKYSDGQPRPGRANLKTLVHYRRVLNPMSLTLDGISSANDYGWITIDPRYKTVTQAMTQAFPTGELWGINSQAFTRASIRRSLASSGEAAMAFGVISAEKLYTRTLENYVSVAVSEMKFRPPFVVELGAVGLKGVYMGAPHPESPSGHYYGPIREDSLVRRYDFSDPNDQVLVDLLREFFDELYDLAECSRSDLLTDEIVSRHAIPPRT
jgi:hypothetical protein